MRTTGRMHDARRLRAFPGHVTRLLALLERGRLDQLVAGEVGPRGRTREEVIHVQVRALDLAHAARVGAVDVQQRHVERQRGHRHPLPVVVGRIDELESGAVPQHVGAEAHPRRDERHAHGGRLEAEQQQALVDLHDLDRSRLARRTEVRFERNEVEGHEGEHQLPHLAGRAQHADVGTAVGHDGEVPHRAAQDLADERHRLAPRAPSANADRNAVTQLRDDFAPGHELVHAGTVQRPAGTAATAAAVGRRLTGRVHRTMAALEGIDRAHLRATAVASLRPKGLEDRRAPRVVIHMDGDVPAVVDHAFRAIAQVRAESPVAPIFVANTIRRFNGRVS